jgi:hypothetical protein
MRLPEVIEHMIRGTISGSTARSPRTRRLTRIVGVSATALGLAGLAAAGPLAASFAADVSFGDVVCGTGMNEVRLTGVRKFQDGDDLPALEATADPGGYKRVNAEGFPDSASPTQICDILYLPGPGRWA